MKVLIIQGHPRPGSLCGALAAAYDRGARAAGAETRLLRLAELAFDPDVTTRSPGEQAQEPDLLEARALVAWAEHVVFVYPTWWGTMPARLKGFLDRLLLPGFAFEERDGAFEPRLSGRSAEIVTTMDTPRWVYRWLYGAPGHRAMARATLGFCGFDTVAVTSFGPVHSSTLEQRSRWLERARELGRRLRRGPRSPLQRVLHSLGIWLRALRPQFYPMTIIAYTVGALGAGQSAFDGPAFALGLLCLMALKAATVLTNDIVDWPSDVRNRNWSAFTGGSRSLVEGRLSVEAMWRGTAVALSISAAAALGVLATAAADARVILAVLGTLAVFALGYTLPPLKLCHRGLGELDVALTHSIGVVLAGHVIQSGAWNDPFPWLVSLPIALAVLPAIILSGIPDHSADEAAGKRTLVVRLGRRRAGALALLCTALAALAAAWSLALPEVAPATRGLPIVAVPHALLVMALLARYLRAGAPERRIDGLMAASLAFIVWFVTVPALNLA